MKKEGMVGGRIAVCPLQESNTLYLSLINADTGRILTPVKVDSRNSGSAMSSPSLRLFSGLKMHRIKVDDAHGQNKVIF